MKATGTPIQLINKDQPLEIFKTCNMSDLNSAKPSSSDAAPSNNLNDSSETPVGGQWGYGGYVCGLAMSDDGLLLAGASIVGCCFIWDAIEWDLLQMLRDPSEKEIEELYCAAFSADSRRVLTCGKLKSRSVWSEEDGDNFVVPGKIKVYDTVTGQVLLRMEGHQEEILSLQRVQFKSDQYWLSCGQDGRVIKWKIEDDYRSYSKQYMDDPTAHYTCALSLLPGTGNKLFATGADEGLKIFDFERNSVRLFLEMGVYHRLMRSVDSSVIP